MSFFLYQNTKKKSASSLISWWINLSDKKFPINQSYSSVLILLWTDIVSQNSVEIWKQVTKKKMSHQPPAYSEYPNQQPPVTVITQQPSERLNFLTYISYF